MSCLNITPEEKWKHINNPQSLEDYKLSLSTEELKTFAGGRQLLALINKGHKNTWSRKQLDCMGNMGRLGARAGQAVREKIIKNLLRTQK